MSSNHWYDRWCPLAQTWVRHITGALVAILGFGPVFYAAIDREPPWWRLRGEIIGEARAGELIRIRWHGTPYTHQCEGLLRIQLQAEALLAPVLERPISNSLKVGDKEYDSPPWLLPRDTPVGPAIYRVTTLWKCNWLQRYFDWPIIQVGPDIAFDVLPPYPNRDL